MRRLLPFLLLVLWLDACAPVPAAAVIPTLAAATAAPSALPSAAPSPRPQVSTAALPAVEVCSPLDGFTLAQMPGLVSNPYHPPKPGSDDPHAGVDLADTVGPNRVALAGRGVRAALSGRVAAVIADRFPFGNAVIVETPLDGLPASWLGQLQLPTPGPTLEPRSALTCPVFTLPSSWDLTRRSLYILYAHMQARPAFQLGQQVSCGQPLGTVGKSGNALNPHLHFEIRAGPAGAQPGSMSHYDSGATQAEMAAYCAWTVSGLFELVDPLKVLAAGE